MMDLSDLDEAHLARMLWAEDPDYGGRVKLSATPGLVRDYRSWLAAECQHITKQTVAIRARNDALMYRTQCAHCGEPAGQWIPKSKVTGARTVPEVHPDKFMEYQSARVNEWHTIQRRHAREQLSGSDNEYALYLRSDAWKDRRAKVLKRAKGVCEGCGNRQATQVHHLTYRHVQDEFLRELVAVCDECHERAHPEEDE